MSIAIRPASPVDDQQQLIDLLERNLPSRQDGSFGWRHMANPAGPSWSWVVYDRKTDAPVAMASVFPRCMQVDGKPVLGGQVGEFVIDASHRSLGPAVQLQRATFGPVNSGALAFCYDCPPHGQGMSTFVRLGMSANSEVIRYALPFRSDAFIAKKLGRGVWTKPLIAITNSVLGMRTPRSTAPGLEISVFSGLFGEEFSRLDKLVSSSGMIRSSRSAEIMNWRYRENPVKNCWQDTGARYRLLLARRSGELQAFVSFFIQSDGIASIVDLFGLNLPRTGIALLEAVIDICWKEGASSLHGFCSHDSALKPLFEHAGMRQRERDANVVAYAQPNGLLAKLLYSNLAWTFSQVEVLL